MRHFLDDLDIICWGLLLTVLLLLCWGVLADAQPRAAPRTPPQCTHFASPQGSGSACTSSSPCKVEQWWALASPGKVLCLKSGTYTGTAQMIRPPSSLSGTQSQPITVRAEHDGKVLLDAAHQGPAVNLQSAWFVVEGINAKNGLENIYRVGGADNTLRRTIGYDGTAGQPNSYPYDIGGKRNRVEDSAGWGVNCRKIFNSSQAGDVAQGGFTRTWGEWNGHPMSEQEPSNTYQMGYNSWNHLWQNILGTWNLRGAHKDPEGVLGTFWNSYEPTADMAGTRLLGGIFYAPPGVNYSATKAAQAGNTKNVYYENVLAYIDQSYPDKWPFYFYGCDTGVCSGNVCKDCLAVHAGARSQFANGSGWTAPGFREGQGLAAATGGRSAFELLPGICYRYEDGALTTTPLWPWPMDQRITDARAASGYPAVHVTADIERLLGPIPAQCKGEAPPPAGDTTPPQVTLTAPTHLALVSGTVAVSATATDNVGVAGIRFYLDKEPVGEEQPGANAYVLAESTTVVNGLHKLKARARDTAGNEADSGTIDVTIHNSAPAAPGHVPLHCEGAIQAGGIIAMQCVPQVGRR